MLNDPNQASRNSAASGVAAMPAHKGRGEVCAVTVTYGNRQDLLQPVLRALLKERAIWKIVVVSNGAPWDVQMLAEQLEADKIEVINLPENRGSAVGYAAGISRALELGSNFIWLLDDDNEPQEGALGELLLAYNRLNERYPKDKLAVAADHFADHGAAHSAKWRASSFWDFHILDLPAKLWRRTRFGRPHAGEPLPATIEMSYAPYGGLLFHRAVVETYGLPRSDFVLYCDDREFTYRITRNGGAVWMITAAKVPELEKSWHSGYKSVCHSWIQGGSDARAFYAARNQAYLESHCFPRNRLVYWINQRAYWSALWLIALISRRRERYRLLQSAVRDGSAGRLGIALRFPL